MEFPKDKMEFSPTHEGKGTEQGWLVLDIRALDLEGVSKIYIDLSEVEKVKQKRVKEGDALQRARKLLDF